jgi:hypothetical protein
MQPIDKLQVHAGRVFLSLCAETATTGADRGDKVEIISGVILVPWSGPR